MCKKSLSSKRKVFDSNQQRIKGTELEQFNHKPYSSSSTNNPGPMPGRRKTLSWRQKHEDFIQTVRAAREINVAVKRGKREERVDLMTHFLVCNKNVEKNY